MNELGKALRKLRIELGITMLTMAKSIDMSPAMLSSIETGKRRAPADFVDKLAATYPAVKANRTEFDKLAEETRVGSRVTVDTSKNPAARDFTLAFARKFDEISPQEVEELMEVFFKRSKR